MSLQKLESFNGWVWLTSFHWLTDDSWAMKEQFFFGIWFLFDELHWCIDQRVSVRFPCVCHQVQNQCPERLSEDDWDVCQNKAQDWQAAWVCAGRGERRRSVGESRSQRLTFHTQPTLCHGRHSPIVLDWGEPAWLGSHLCRQYPFIKVKWQHRLRLLPLISLNHARRELVCFSVLLTLLLSGKSSYSVTLSGGVFYLPYM